MVCIRRVAHPSTKTVINMKKVLTLILLVMTTLSSHAYTPWTKGAFETRQYRNLFVEMGYEPAAVEAKLKEVFNDVFRGPNKVYFEVGDSMGYVSDIKNHDARRRERYLRPALAMEQAIHATPVGSP